MHVFWHRRDLRIPDNRGLAKAAADDSVLPVFVVDPGLLVDVGARQQAFWMAGVRDLKACYRERGSDLLVRTGHPADVLENVVDEFDADDVVTNLHFRPTRRERERAVRERLPTTTITDLVLVDPERLQDAYPTHSQFFDDWQRQHKPAPLSVQAENLVGVEEDETPPEVQSDIDLPDAGYEAARERYDEFLESGIDTYRDTRDDMAAAVENPVGAVSRLSPYLAAGMIGIREVWKESTDRHDAVSGPTQKNVQKFRYELSWREWYYHLLHYNQNLLEENYKTIPNEIAWENDPDHIEAWKRGETGYPFVDAGMRQLEEEGYIHNRPRQNVASFLTKHLLVDWRIGAEYFAEKLIDHDAANNYANWQWVAGTGTDSVDVRIFDPVAQMHKYDAGADYVKAYVPELREVDPELVVDWPNLSDGDREQLAPDYPHPVVDRDEAYERAQRVFEAALGKR